MVHPEISPWKRRNSSFEDCIVRISSSFNSWGVVSREGIVTWEYETNIAKAINTKQHTDIQQWVCPEISWSLSTKKPRSFNWPPCFNHKIHPIPSGKWTWNLKSPNWKAKSSSQLPFFGFQGVISQNLEVNKLENKNPCRVHEINKSSPKFSVAKKSPTPGFEGILDTMFALFNAPFHSDQLTVRDFEPPKTSPRNPPQKQISLHPRRSTYPPKITKQSPQKKLDNFFQPPKEPPQRKQHTNWFFWDFFWYPSCKTLVAWVIYGMKSYPVVQGLFHEPINGCQVIQCDFFIPDRWRSLDHAKKVTKNCQDSRMMFFFNQTLPLKMFGPPWPKTPNLRRYDWRILKKKG